MKEFERIYGERVLYLSFILHCDSENETRSPVFETSASEDYTAVGGNTSREYVILYVTLSKFFILQRSEDCASTRL